MDEFLNLFLTGERAKKRKRRRLLSAILGGIGFALVLLSVILLLSVEESPALIIAFAVITMVTETAGDLLEGYQIVYDRRLAEAQHAANQIELSGEEREIYFKLYTAWRESMGKIRCFGPKMVLSLSGALFLTVAVIICAVLSAPTAVIFAACIVFGLLTAVSTVMGVREWGRAGTALYERAEGEIEWVKRQKFGLSEEEIARQSETAQAYAAVPLSVRMFLKEKVELADFRTVSLKNGAAGCLIGLLIAVIFLLFFLGEWIGPAITWTLAGILLVMAAVIVFVLLFPLECRKKEIYKRNLEKLNEGEADTIRKQLQEAWLRSQHAGNLMFSFFLVGALVIGTVLGIVGYVMMGGVALSTYLGSCIMSVLVPAAILSLIVWIIMFNVYRKKVRPLEMRLKALEEVTEAEKGEWI